MKPNFFAPVYSRRFPQFVLTTRLCFFILIFAALTTGSHAQTSSITVVPTTTGAAGGPVSVIHQVRFVPTDDQNTRNLALTGKIYNSQQQLVGAYSVNLTSTTPDGLNNYVGYPSLPANYSNVAAVYTFVSDYRGSAAPCVVDRSVSPVIQDVTTIRTLGAAGIDARIYIKYRSSSPDVPYLYGPYTLRLKIEKPDGTSAIIGRGGTNNDFSFSSSDSASTTCFNYDSYTIPPNYTNAPQVYKLTASIIDLPWLPDFNGGTITVNPSVSPVIQSVTTNRTLGAAGSTAYIFVKYRNTSDVPYINGNSALRLKIQKPDGISTTIGGGNYDFVSSSNDSSSVTYRNYDGINFPANYTNAPQVYKLTASIAWLPWLPDFDGGTVTVLSAMANVSGMLALDSLSSNAAPQAVTFTFRPADNTAPIIKTVNVDATGMFSLAGIPRKPYQLHIKAAKYLAANGNIDTTNSDVLNLAAMLPAGDANNDNSVDSTDFGLLIGAYGSAASIPGSGYDPMMDFNGDGSIDSTDFGLLISNFNQIGDM